MKKEELRHDPIRENIVKGVQYFSENTSTVLQILAVVVLAVGGLSYYNHTGNIKMESASHLAGRAQNIFINGNLDEAIVKFERVLADYPNTPGAAQSLVYLLNDAMTKNDIEEAKRLLNENDGSINDPHVLAAIYKLQGDISLTEADFSTALKYFQKAENIAEGNPVQSGFQLDIAATLLAQNDYEKALQTLEEIIDNEDVGFNEKNIAEELIAYTKQKMGI
ncbi:MAG TPA: tetratricopeptide repeat protein [Candidatus Marinimicrobia bacterium]|nr:tetratricopeptide repeat protein [Candidatus Neomarinimicrobiota bacterium]